MVPFSQKDRRKSSDGFSPHFPVLLPEVLLASESAAPKNMLDCTFGRGGHTGAFLSRFSKLRVLALDWDEEAIKYGKGLSRASRVQFLRANFHHFPEKFHASPSLFMKWKAFDVILMDLGVSSPQLDQGERGFSFSREGPLDMRMDQRGQVTGEDLVNGLSKKALIQLFREYGEIKYPFSVVDAIFEKRKRKRIQTTGELARLIQKSAPRSRLGRHPATSYFLALRMKVNAELEGLENSLPAFLPLLNSGGCFMVISFHSLEDRIVKHTFKQFVQRSEGLLWNKKVITPSSEERKLNPRSRSAKLRVFVKN